MTDQIAPSLATELEQAAKEQCWDAGPDKRDGWTFLMHCTDCGCWEDEGHLEECSRLATFALLTRAAALARAAEKITEWFPLRIDRDEMGYECVFCYGWHLDTPEVEHKADCAWMQLRALVSSEGKGE